MKTKNVEKYKTSAGLVLSGGFKSITESKCYHGLLILCQINNWKSNSRGEYRISLNNLHKLTQKACNNWEEYLRVFDRIKEVQLEWAHLSKRIGGFNRVGKVGILSESWAELDLSGKFQEIVCIIPQALILDVIQPQWYGQVNPEILFSIHSNYAFNAYLFASCTIVEKDSKKDEFWSEARTIQDWRELLGVEEGKYVSGHAFRSKIFRRIENQIKKTTDKTDEPIEIEFSDVSCTKGLYQMRVRRIRKYFNEESDKSLKFNNLNDDQKNQLWEYIRRHRPEFPTYPDWTRVTPASREQIIGWWEDEQN